MSDNVPNKEGLQESAEKLYDELTAKPGEQPQESTPATEQEAPQTVDGSDPAKTPSTPETSGNKVDKGFADHPAWIERENKYKEAKELLKAKEAEAERYSKLLDDPEVYAKWLKQQGYSEAHVAQALREKGYQAPQKETEKNNQAQAIAQRACAKLGWDITRLNDEQKAYINDSVNLTMAVIEESVRPMLDQRFGPIEEMSQEMQAHKQFNADEIAVKKLASEEFKDVDWEAVIKPAITKYLADLDEKDPKRTIKLSYEDIYYRATRPLLRELNETKGRQEVRNVNKSNARPLGTGVSSKTAEPFGKGRSAREEAEAFLESRNVR